MLPGDQMESIVNWSGGNLNKMCSFSLWGKDEDEPVKLCGKKELERESGPKSRRIEREQQKSSVEFKRQEGIRKYNNTQRMYVYCQTLYMYIVKLNI